MIKLLHLSDTHIDNPETADALSDRLKYIARTFPNHYTVYTGDITDDGEAHEYAAASQLIHRFVVPGNHDVKKTGVWPAERRKLRAFDRTFGTHYASSQFPQVDILENRVALIGLNSNPLAWQFYLSFARGNIGIRQRLHLKEELRALRGFNRVVYLHHHPFTRDPFMALHDSHELMDILFGNVEVLLFGHEHQQSLWHGGAWMNADMKTIPIIHAAGALHKESQALEIVMQDDGVLQAQYVSII